MIDQVGSRKTVRSPSPYTSQWRRTPSRTVKPWRSGCRALMTTNPRRESQNANQGPHLVVRIAVPVEAVAARARDISSTLTLSGMGSWGPGIFSNDVSADIRGDFREL